MSKTDRSRWRRLFGMVRYRASMVASAQRMYGWRGAGRTLRVYLTKTASQDVRGWWRG